MIDRGEAFLTQFNAIEAHFRGVLRKPGGTRFTELISGMRSKLLITDSQASQLRTYAALRNALAHWDREGDAIADPRPSALEDIRALHAKLIAPRRLVEVLAQEVSAVQGTDPIQSFFLLVKTKDFSQAPVMASGRFVGMITAGIVARWAADGALRDKMDWVETPILDVLDGNVTRYDEFKVCAPDVTTVEALNHFDIIDEHLPENGLVVIESDHDGDNVLAIVTTADIPLLLSEAG